VKFRLEVPASLTLRELIRLRVRDEVARHNAASSASYQGLVCPEGATVSRNGFEFREGWKRIDWEGQADIAVTAFTRNGFFVLAGGRQLEDLDEVIDLENDAELTFVRLMHLVGG
jgi:hypothetical protein